MDRPTRNKAELRWPQTKAAGIGGRVFTSPRKIERVYSYFTGKTYVEGTDWKLTGKGTLIAPPGSSIKVTDDTSFIPLMERMGGYSRQTTGAFCWRLKCGIPTGTFGYDVTHDDDWKGPIPALAEKGTADAREAARQEPLKIVVYGDSISAGAGATAHVHMPPFLLPSPDLVAENREAITRRRNHGQPVSGRSGRGVGGGERGPSRGTGSSGSMHHRLRHER